MNETKTTAHCSLEKLIAVHPFCADMEPRLWKLLDQCASLRRFGPGQRIFNEGNEADHFFLMLCGEVRLETFVPGCGMVPIQTVGSGEVIGWSWLFQPYQWKFSATTTKFTEVISLDAKALRSKAEVDVEFHDQLITRVARTLANRLEGTREQLVDLYGIRP